MASDVLRIDRRFRGPPHSGNGGYVAGLLARELGGECMVTLRSPPPLDEALGLEQDADGASLWFGDDLVATAAAASIAVEPPPPPTLDQAIEAATRFSGFRSHNFPGCFVCGPGRPPGDGLRIFPGALADPAHQVAAPWAPHADLADAEGQVRTEFLWAALDCPGYFAVEAEAGLAVLGRLGVVRRRAVPVGAPLVVTGWPIAHDGRKHTVGTAVHDEAGTLLAAAVGVWVTLRA